MVFDATPMGFRQEAARRAPSAPDPRCWPAGEALGAGVQVADAQQASTGRWHRSG